MCEAEFEEVFRALSPDLLRFALLRLDEGAAEDVVAESFATLWRKGVAFPANTEEDRALRALAFSILSGHIRNEYRSRSRRREFLARYIHERSESQAGPDPAESHVEKAQLLWWTAPLSITERDVLSLFSAGFTVIETAQILGISEAAVAKRRTRAKARLRRYLRRRGEVADE